MIEERSLGDETRKGWQGKRRRSPLSRCSHPSLSQLESASTRRNERAVRNPKGCVTPTAPASHPHISTNSSFLFSFSRIKNIILNKNISVSN